MATTELFVLVRRMRALQRAYFDKNNAHRRDSLLRECKAIEQQVDNYIAHIDADLARLLADQLPLPHTDQVEQSR